MVERTLTTKDLIKKYNRTHLTIYTWLKEGLPHSRIMKGKKSIYVFNEKEVDNWILEKMRSR